MLMQFNNLIDALFVIDVHVDAGVASGNHEKQKRKIQLRGNSLEIRSLFSLAQTERWDMKKKSLKKH